MEQKTLKVLKIHIEKDLVNKLPTIVLTDENGKEWVLEEVNLKERGKSWYFDKSNAR